MKSILGFIVLVSAASTVLANAVDTQGEFTIRGTYIADDSSVYESVETPNEAERIDLSTTIVEVTYKQTNEAGESQTVELATGTFEDGKVYLAGKIDEPMDILIAVRTDADISLTLPAVAIPGGEEIEFALLDFQSFPPDRLAFVGASRKVKNPSKKFTISGELSSIDKDLSLANVRVTGWGFDDRGNQKAIDSGDMLLRDDQFVFEGEIEEATLLSIRIAQGKDPYFWTQTQAVVEQGSEITVYSPGSANQIIATADSGRHARLIESWQQNEKYLAKMHEYGKALREFETQQDAEPLLVEESTQAGLNTDKIDTESEETDAGKENEEETRTVLKMETTLAEGCEHVSLEDLRREATDLSNEENLPRHFLLAQEMEEIKIETLESIAINAEDPFDSLLAMELGALSFRSKNRNQGLIVYDRISKLLDDGIVARRVTPRRNSLASNIEVIENDERLVPGQKAPNFSHPNLEGNETSLQDVLQENEVVLIDFWASWCAPCIAKFPDMKKLYASYEESGFEILSNSIDSTHEAWVEASEEHQLPWTSVGEIEGWEGKTTRAYGVRHIPKSYLLDSQGCIIQKDIVIEDLKDVLLARFGDASSGHSSE
ncbi:MAG: TlpA disulfide reductase family protein [Gammaproteobacteria bacterium]|nr:TlpA disulfide reductase family protein [Gammaproteobacteria bacterium]